MTTNKFKVVTHKDLKPDQKVRMIDLRDGSAREITILATGTVGFEYRWTSGVSRRMITDPTAVVLIAEDEKPVNWPPRPNDVWAVLSTYSSAVNSMYHMVAGKLRCDQGHECTPEEFLKKYGYKGKDKLKLIFREGKQVG